MQNQLETTFNNCRICLKGTLDCIRNFPIKDYLSLKDLSSHDFCDFNWLNLKAIDSELVACEEVDCNQAEEIGQQI